MGTSFKVSTNGKTDPKVLRGHLRSPSAGTQDKNRLLVRTTSPALQKYPQVDDVLQECSVEISLSISLKP